MKGNMPCYIKKNQKRKDIAVFEPIGAVIFTYRHTFIKNPCWQSGEIIVL